MYIKSLEQANLKAWKINQSFPGAVGEWGANAKEYSVSFLCIMKIRQLQTFVNILKAVELYTQKGDFCGIQIISQ